MTDGAGGRVESIHISPGGVPKNAVGSATVLDDRIAGDDHNDKVFHGGPDRAVCLYSSEIIEALQAEGHPIFPGSAGENLTVRGLKWEKVVPGTIFRIGDVALEVTGYASPCKTIRESFTDAYFNRISEKLYPGWSRVYARVIDGGKVNMGDSITVRDRRT